MGVQHALAHPGMRFLLLTNGSPRTRAALALGGGLARRIHARVTVLGRATADQSGEQAVQDAKEQLGAGIAAIEARLTAEEAAAGSP